MEGIVFRRDPATYNNDPPELRDLSLAERLATMFPALRELSFPDQDMCFADLQAFHSKMPNLETLRFNFNSMPFDLKVDLSTVARYRRSSFQMLEADFFSSSQWARLGGNIARFRYNEAAWLVRYLFSLGPNVQIAARPEEDSLTGHSTQKKMIALINDHLAALSYCNKDPTAKYEDIRMLTADSWKQCLK
ncbi:hypothetical protein FRC07_011045 [Ceratobasidium sp. 392]|nr:hypothetical protein FRC07_011045 [Ceratobasidium sp. 392]